MADCGCKGYNLCPTHAAEHDARVESPRLHKLHQLVQFNMHKRSFPVGVPENMGSIDIGCFCGHTNPDIWTDVMGSKASVYCSRCGQEYVVQVEKPLKPLKPHSIFHLMDIVKCLFGKTKNA